MLHIFLRVVEETLHRSSPGAVSFLHRFGSALNPHLHFHGCVIDGLFEPATSGRMRFHEAVGLSEACVASVQEEIRRRILRGFVRRGPLEPEAARNLRQWDHGGGFSVTEAHAVVPILQAIGEPTRPPHIVGGAWPPEWEEPLDHTPAFDPTEGQPEPAFAFDQTVIG